MDIYEKKYKEALERAKEALNDGTISQNTIDYLCNIFPELCESEDERIRKVLIDYFNRYKEQEECGVKTFYGIPTGNIIAWLEKQKPVKRAEEDEEMINAAIRACKYMVDNFENSTKAYEDAIIWLKSLKERIGGEQ